MINIEKFCIKYNLGKVINITKIVGGLIHKTFKVETDKGIYCIKILNPEVMSRKERLEFYSIIESLENYKNTKNEERMQEVKEKIKCLYKFKKIESHKSNPT